MRLTDRSTTSTTKGTMRAAFSLALAFAAVTPASAAVELHVLSAGAVQQPVTQVVSAFEQRTGDRVDLSFNQVGKVRRAFAAGQPADVIILSAPALRSFEQRGAIVRGSAVALGETSVGVGVRRGAPLPDISTPAAFRRTLLAARSITYTDPATGSSGAQVYRMLRQLGLVDALKHKTVLTYSGFGGTQVVNGRADMVIQNISEIKAVPGVTLVGPLPAALQSHNTYVAAVSAHAAHPREAQALIDALTRPGERARWRDDGFLPTTY
jgi:molybdate transport system substrate-binding protein